MIAVMTPPNKKVELVVSVTMVTRRAPVLE
jgi:hypothetical protein